MQRCQSNLSSLLTSGSSKNPKLHRADCFSNVCTSKPSLQIAALTSSTTACIRRPDDDGTITTPDLRSNFRTNEEWAIFLYLIIDTKSSLHKITTAEHCFPRCVRTKNLSKLSLYPNLVVSRYQLRVSPFGKKPKVKWFHETFHNLIGLWRIIPINLLLY